MSKWFVAFVVVLSLAAVMSTMVAVNALAYYKLGPSYDLCGGGKWCDDPSGLGKHYCEIGMKIDSCKQACDDYCDLNSCGASNFKSNCEAACTKQNGCTA